MKQYIKLATIAATVLASTHAYAQAVIGGGGGGGAGDAIVQYFYTNYMHAIAAAGLLVVLIGAVLMRSHLQYFVIVGVALLAVGNYQAILALFNL